MVYFYHRVRNIPYQEVVYEAKGQLIWLDGLFVPAGLIGIFSEEKLFLTFFAFAVDFEYFFMRSDEMLEEYMNARQRGPFYWGMLTAGLAALAGFSWAGWGPGRRLSQAFGRLGVAVAVYALSTAYYGCKERWGLAHDHE